MLRRPCSLHQGGGGGQARGGGPGRGWDGAPHPHPRHGQLGSPPAPSPCPATPRRTAAVACDRPRTRLARCGIPARRGSGRAVGGTPRARGASGWAVMKRRLLAWRTECALSCDSILRALWAGNGISKMEPLATGQPHWGWDCWEVLSRHPLPAGLSALLTALSPAQPQAPCPLPAARLVSLNGWRLDAVERESEGCCWWWRGSGRHSCPPDIITHWLWRGWMDLWRS